MQNLLALIGVLILTTQVMAGAWTPNNFLYKPDEGARGKDEKAWFDSGSNRIDARLGKEIWVGDPNYGPTFQDAITAIGATPVILRLPPGTHSINANLSIPGNITLAVERGAILSIATGQKLTINGTLEAGPYQIFSCTGTGKVDFTTNRSILYIYTEWWGAKADDATDSSAAFQSAFDSIGDDDTLRPTPIKLLAGVYRIHEVNRVNLSLLEGVEPNITRLQYNGAGGANSYVIGFYKTTGAVPRGGFKNLAIWGWDGSASGKIAEHCYLQAGGVGEDWGFKFSNVHFACCFGDAVVLGAVINLHFDRVRFDDIGGFAIAIVGSGSIATGGENRPFSLTQWTLDNNTTNISADFETAAVALGYFDGSRWGKGFLSILDMPGIQVHISDGRIELNHSLIPATGTTKCIVLNNNTTTNRNASSIYLENISGYFAATDAGIVIKDLTGSCNGVFQNVVVDNAAKLYEASVLGWTSDTVAYRYDRPGDRIFGAGNVKANDGRLFEQGIFVNGRRIEFRNARPNTSVKTPYMAGDLIYNVNTPYYKIIPGWLCVKPTSGYAVPSTPTITTAGVTTATSATVTLPADAAWKWVGTGANIKLAGAGAAGVDLLTYITAVNPDGLTITVAVAPSTSVNPCTITMQAPTFAVIGAQAGTTANRPTLTSDDPGFCWWDTSIGKAIFWDGSAWKLADGSAP